jgi:hypothetical protein
MPARDAATSEELEATRATNAVLDRIRAMQSGIGPGQTDPAEPSLPPEQAVYTETQDPLDRWHRRIEEAQRDRDQGWFLDPVLGVVDATVFAVGDFFEQTVRAIQPPVVPVRPLYLSEDRTANALLLQYESPQALEKTWTTLIAPSEGTLLSAAHQLVQADTWNALDGQAVALSPEMVKVVLPVPLDPYFVRTSDPSTRELWLLASNAVSQYLLVWVCLVLITIALLGVTTSRLVRRMGRSSATDR